MSEKKNLFNVGLGSDKYETQFKELCFDKTQFNIPKSFVVVSGKCYNPKDENGVSDVNKLSATLYVVNSEGFKVAFDSLCKVLGSKQAAKDTLVSGALQVVIQDYKGNVDDFNDIDLREIKLGDFEIVPRWIPNNYNGVNSGSFSGIKIIAKGFDFIG